MPGIIRGCKTSLCGWTLRHENYLPQVPTKRICLNADSGSTEELNFWYPCQSNSFLDTFKQVKKNPSASNLHFWNQCFKILFTPEVNAVFSALLRRARLFFQVLKPLIAEHESSSVLVVVTCRWVKFMFVLAALSRNNVDLKRVKCLWYGTNPPCIMPGTSVYTRCPVVSVSSTRVQYWEYYIASCGCRCGCGRCQRRSRSLWRRMIRICTDYNSGLFWLQAHILKLPVISGTIL